MVGKYKGVGRHEHDCILPVNGSALGALGHA